MPLPWRAALLSVVAAYALACQRSPQFSAVGAIEAIDSLRQRVVIRHAEIPGALSAGSTSFEVPTADRLAGIAAGARVRFEFQHAGSRLVITHVAPIDEGRPGVHDHTPHHGGVVAMAGMIHLEALAEPDGRVRLYLTDVWRRPLPLNDVHGVATLGLPGSKQTLALAVTGDALEATSRPPTAAPVHAQFELTRGGGKAIEMNFVLPVTPGSGGAAGVLANVCQPPAPRGDRGVAVPRCTLRFARPITAVAATPDVETLLIAAVDLGVTAWRLPAGQLMRTLALPPPITVPVAEAPHPEAVNAIAVRPDGREAVVAVEGRLLRYSIATGQVVREIKGPGGIVRAVAWSPDGNDLLVTAFFDAAAHLLGAEDGQERRRFAVEREGAAVAFAAGGRLVAVGSEVGPIALYDATSGAPTRQLIGPRRATQSLVFWGDRLVSAGDDGHVRVWDVDSGLVLQDVTLAGPVVQVSLKPNESTIACASDDGRITLLDLRRGAVVDTLAWHSAQVLGMAWAGATLASGDGGGELALWEIGEH